MRFKFLFGMGFCHYNKRLYFGGGEINYECFSEMRMITPLGESKLLEQMPTMKCFFPLVVWKERSYLFTVGVWNGEKKLG